MTPSDKALHEALTRVRNFPDLAPIKALIASEIGIGVDMMIGQNDEKIMWRAQGAVRMLNKLLNLIENSQAVLDKPRPLTSVGGGFLTSNSP